MLIRQMNDDDLEDLIAMGYDMHQESWFHNLNYDPHKLRLLYESIKAYPARLCAFVAEEGDKKVGMFVGGIAEFYFGNDKLASDLLLFVTKEHRGSTAAPRLIKAYIAWAKANEARSINLGISTSINVDRTAKLYEKLGFTLDGHLFRMRN
jgi:GNAT superfamily N-acetyltransferase